MHAFVRQRHHSSARRVGFAAILLCGCLALLSHKLQAVDFAVILTTLQDITAHQWGIAALATVLSFVAVGQYDALFHRWLHTGVAPRRAAFAGASAIALAQLAGLGLITGSLARWRALPELSASQSIKITHYVSFSFMLALGMLVACLLATTALPHTDGIGIFGGAAATFGLLAIVWSLVQPRFLPFRVPPLALLCRLMLVMLVDVLLAAAALFVLLPSGTEIDFGLFLAAFVLALAAGLISGTPGGFGPFELCLLALLPGTPEEPILAAVLGFRIICYFVPAGLGVLYIVAPKRRSTTARSQEGAEAERAELRGLANANGHGLIRLGQQSFHIAEASQHLVVIGDCSRDRPITPQGLRGVVRLAKARCLSLAFYKSSARTAAVARRCGWSVLRISEEAFLRPAEFTTEGSQKRQLRRQLRKAAEKGIFIECPQHLPIEDMADIAWAWAARVGGERGFSMGRFDTDYLRSQRCFLAWKDERLIAFATFHHTKDEWCLDLMRSGNEAGDGVMHALIVDALRQARAENVALMSLAALPLDDPKWPLSLIPASGGLRRFKLSFAPELKPLYVAAPTPLRLAFAGLDLLLRIRWPDGRKEPVSRPALQNLQTGLSKMAIVEKAPTAHIAVNKETPRPMEATR
ncbi:MAG: phosphatidylglycerol lysyltransferase domain-containing protein [Pseudomonadota bacterium]